MSESLPQIRIMVTEACPADRAVILADVTLTPTPTLEEQLRRAVADKRIQILRLR